METKPHQSKSGRHKKETGIPTTVENPGKSHKKEITNMISDKNQTIKITANVHINFVERYTLLLAHTLQSQGPQVECTVENSQLLARAALVASPDLTETLSEELLGGIFRAILENKTKTKLDASIQLINVPRLFGRTESVSGQKRAFGMASEEDISLVDGHHASPTSSSTAGAGAGAQPPSPSQPQHPVDAIPDHITENISSGTSSAEDVMAVTPTSSSTAGAGASAQPPSPSPSQPQQPVDAIPYHITANISSDTVTVSYVDWWQFSINTPHTSQPVAIDSIPTTSRNGRVPTHILPSWQYSVPPTPPPPSEGHIQSVQVRQPMSVGGSNPSIAADVSRHTMESSPTRPVANAVLQEGVQ